LPPADDKQAEQKLLSFFATYMLINNFLASCFVNSSWKTGSTGMLVCGNDHTQDRHMTVPSVFNGLAAVGPCQKQHACPVSVHAAQTGSYSGLFVPDPSNSLIDECNTHFLPSNNLRMNHTNELDR